MCWASRGAIEALMCALPAQIDLSRHIGGGQGVWWGQGAGEPAGLVSALLEQSAMIGSLEAFCGITWNEDLVDGLPEQIRLRSYGALGLLRRLVARDRLEVLPVHYSALPRMFAAGHIRTDVGMVQVSPPDADGFVTLGVGVDYTADAVIHTRTLLGEVNEQMPSTIGGPRLHVDQFAALIYTSRPLVEVDVRVGDDIDRRIAAHVAEQIADGDTLQIGVGSLPQSVLAHLAGHADLGVHTGMITDGIIDLLDKGVITGSRKDIDTGRIVTGTALGSARTYARATDPAIEFRSTSYTHAPQTLAQLSNLVAVNSALEVDLHGQVGSEVANGTYLGAVGGQVDFARAASQGGARSIFALRSERRGVSTIRPHLASGVVTTGRADVDVIVTEHGAAVLTGCDEAARRSRLIAIAGSDHREQLARANHHRTGPT